MAERIKNPMKSKKKVADKDATPFEVDSEKLEVKEPEYSSEEAEYRGFLLRLLEQDRNNREQPHDEFNGMTYTQRYVENFKAGNSYTPPRKNKEDTSLVTGTTREKKNAVINSVLSLVFDTTFRAFDNNNLEDQQLGEAMTDCVFQANQVEQWDEKKIYAYSELADQGDVFIEDLWIDEVRIDKRKMKIKDLNEETFKNFNPTKSVKVVYSGPRRRVVPGMQVYLGNIREPDIKLQPRIFTRQVIPYALAKSIFGTLPRWKNVPYDLIETDGENSDHFGFNWRLETIGKDMVEILCYQDKWNDEYQILLNGVMQLPVGFPMPWEHGEYNIVHGHLEPISPFFAYSKSIPDKTFLDQKVLDEMYRLAVLKTQKSFMPPIANYSANILTQNMFLPGKINNDLEKGEIEVLGGNPNMYSLQTSEFEMMKMIKGYIDEKSVSPVLTGQDTFGDRATAVEVDSVTKQAKQALGVMIFGFLNLHLNLDHLRLLILLENYTKENGEKVDKLNNKLEKKFRAISVERDLGERGTGVKRIEFTEKAMSPEELYDLEEGVSRDGEGKPTSIIPPKKPMKYMQISPSTLRSIKYRWYPEVTVNERESSLAERISFEDRIVKAAQFFGIESLNMEYIKQQWSAKNKIDPSFFFTQGEPPMVPQEQVDAIQESSVGKINRSSPTGVQSAARQGAGGQ